MNDTPTEYPNPPCTVCGGPSVASRSHTIIYPEGTQIEFRVAHLEPDGSPRFTLCLYHLMQEIRDCIDGLDQP